MEAPSQESKGNIRPLEPDPGLGIPPTKPVPLNDGLEGFPPRGFRKEWSW